MQKIKSWGGLAAALAAIGVLVLGFGNKQWATREAVEGLTGEVIEVRRDMDWVKKDMEWIKSSLLRIEEKIDK